MEIEMREIFWENVSDFATEIFRERMGLACERFLGKCVRFCERFFLGNG
jgi:hypothetical protein